MPRKAELTPCVIDHLTRGPSMSRVRTIRMEPLAWSACLRYAKDFFGETFVRKMRRHGFFSESAWKCAFPDSGVVSMLGFPICGLPILTTMNSLEYVSIPERMNATMYALVADIVAHAPQILMIKVRGGMPEVQRRALAYALNDFTAHKLARVAQGDDSIVWCRVQGPIVGGHHPCNCACYQIDHRWCRCSHCIGPDLAAVSCRAFHSGCQCPQCAYLVKWHGHNDLGETPYDWMPDEECSCAACVLYALPEPEDGPTRVAISHHCPHYKSCCATISVLTDSRLHSSTCKCQFCGVKRIATDSVSPWTDHVLVCTPESKKWTYYH